MKYLKLFVGFFKLPEAIDIKVSEADKIKALPGFDFIRMNSSVYGYHLAGNRTSMNMESITIYKTTDGFTLNIRRAPGYFKDIRSSFWTDDNIQSLEWEHTFNFEDIPSLKEFLLNYKWYDIEQYKKPYIKD